MSVSRRNTFIATAGALALIAAGSVAYAGGGMGGGKHHGGNHGGGHHGGGHDGGPCCGKGPKGHGIKVPGINIAGPNISVTQGSIITNTSSYLNVNVAGNGGGDVTFIGGGGGGYFASQGLAPSTIGALNVEGNVETYMETITEQVPTTEEYCEERISLQETVRPVQAVCIDDKGTPHPASRIDASQQIAADYRGEVFRCMAGTSMQVTLGSIEEGKASFAHGESFACRKGEALVHKGNGNLACAPQTPQRSCNERSLLRRHGPGLKIIQTRVQAKTCVPATRTVMKSVQRQVERTRAAKSQPMVFDGGVGQGVY